MPNYECRRKALDQRRMLSIEDLSAEDLQNIMECEGIRERLKNNWPLHRPTDFVEMLNYKGDNLLFDEVKQYIESQTNGTQ